ncbi:hypothetical protein [Corynebacterium vitaeruminis]|nr:hypothetical protein [Corynebacterium vitaeruminis]
MTRYMNQQLNDAETNTGLVKLWKKLLKDPIMVTFGATLLNDELTFSA